MKNKTTLIIMGIVLALMVLFVASLFSTYNRAVGAEEQINEAKSSINIQEKRRVDLIYNLVDTVEAYADYEKETLELVISARANANGGKVENAQLMLAAVAEAYPELKANENYKQLMNELSITENIIAQHRDNFNIQVKDYRKFTRKPMTRLRLNIMGYEYIDFEYLEYDASEDAPTDLFNN